MGNGLQRAAGTHYIADAVAVSAGGCSYRFLKLREVENADINQRLLGDHRTDRELLKADSFVIEDGVVELHEQTATNDELYLSISAPRSMQHWSTKSSALQKE